MSRRKRRMPRDFYRSWWRYAFNLPSPSAVWTASFDVKDERDEEKRR